MPPRSFVSSVYCAPPSSIRSRSLERVALQELRGAWALDVQLAHVRDVEHAPARADGDVLRNHAVVLNGHLPAGERHHARPEGDVPLVQRRPPERLDDVHGPRLYSERTGPRAPNISPAMTQRAGPRRCPGRISSSAFKTCRRSSAGATTAGGRRPALPAGRPTASPQQRNMKEGARGGTMGFPHDQTMGSPTSSFP